MAQSQQNIVVYVQFYGWYKQVSGHCRATLKQYQHVDKSNE